ncbi:MAG: four helix bundle suffix domain-containing protein [Candidatus Edwardsbacteria bacterium]|nr:four helix bundle suffix domain-containing protein [Candidatus Edwardsbacteria bacterium]
MDNPDTPKPSTTQAQPRVIPPHGGYRNLKSYQMAEIIHDATVVFCERFVDRFSRTRDQMVQAARSGKQNIAEGSQVSGTSKASEIKLVGVARASLEELLVDLQDYLRQHALALWGKDDPKAKAVRAIGRERDRSYGSYKTYFEESNAETAANALVCLVHQANYLLDQQLRALEKEVVEKGGFNERLYQARVNYRQANRSG